MPRASGRRDERARTRCCSRRWRCRCLDARHARGEQSQPLARAMRATRETLVAAAALAAAPIAAIAGDVEALRAEVRDAARRVRNPLPPRSPLRHPRRDSLLRLRRLHESRKSALLWWCSASEMCLARQAAPATAAMLRPPPPAHEKLSAQPRNESGRPPPRRARHRPQRERCPPWTSMRDPCRGHGSSTRHTRMGSLRDPRFRDACPMYHALTALVRRG